MDSSDIVTPRDYSSLCGMTNIQERNFFYHYGKNLYRGLGAVVDLGCCLGSTTIPLTEGLLGNSAFLDRAQPVFAYDLFRWADYYDFCVKGTELEGRFKPGDLVVEQFKKNIEHLGTAIEVRVGDVSAIGWHGTPIEFLLIDVMKNWDLCNSIIRDFYPSLIPGSSIVVHQDFSHYYTSWIHLMNYRFREYFEVERDIEYSASLVVKYVRQIPSELLQRTYRFSDFNDDEIDAAFDYSLTLTLPHKACIIWAAKAMTFAHQKRLPEARAALAECIKQGHYRADEFDIQCVEEHISSLSNR